MSAGSREKDNVSSALGDPAIKVQIAVKESVNTKNGLILILIPLMFVRKPR